VIAIFGGAGFGFFAASSWRHISTTVSTTASNNRINTTIHHTLRRWRVEP
jgi:hypothetical protein